MTYMKVKAPLVSVIMGVCYKNDDLFKLKRAIKSILNQTYTNLEILICEFGSTAEAISYLKYIETIDERVCLIDGFSADTLTKKLNICILHSNGDFIARMDDDDECDCNRIKKQMDFLIDNPEYAVVGCCVNEIDAETIRTRILPVRPSLKDFKFTFPFVHPSLLFRKEVIVKTGMYSESKYQIGCDDYDLMLRIYKNGYIGANLQDVLLNYSIEKSQIKKRPYKLFVNEAITRFLRFKELNLLPKWLIWVIKPLIVGIMPRKMVYILKNILRR